MIKDWNKIYESGSLDTRVMLFKSFIWQIQLMYRWCNKTIWNLKMAVWVWDIHPRVTHCLASQGFEGQIFLSTPNNHNRFFFLHTCWSPAFDFNIGFAINESRSYMLMSAILKVGIVFDAAMTSAPNVLTTELHDLLYNQCFDNTCSYSFLSIPHGQIRENLTSIIWYAKK